MKVWKDELKVIQTRLSEQEKDDDTMEPIAPLVEYSTNTNANNTNSIYENDNFDLDLEKENSRESKAVSEVGNVELEDLYRLNGLRVSNDSLLETKENVANEFGDDASIALERERVLEEYVNSCDLESVEQQQSPVVFGKRELENLPNDSDKSLSDEQMRKEKSEKFKEERRVIALEKKRRNRNNSSASGSSSSSGKSGCSSPSVNLGTELGEDSLKLPIEEKVESAEEKAKIEMEKQEEAMDDFWKYGVHRTSMLFTLKSLNLGGCVGLNERSVISLIKRSPHLTTLCIPAVDISNLTLLHLSRHCLRLQNLNLSLCSQVSGFGLRYCLESLRNLKQLDISGITALTDMVLEDAAANCANLRHLDISYCLFSARAIAHVLKSCRHLDTLRLKTSAENTMYLGLFEDLLLIRPRLNLIRNEIQ
jgi:hypothetical protein